jgi:fluoride exporter
VTLRLPFALVGAGGALGGLVRYALTTTVPEAPGALPWTTWAINVSGSFLLGLLVAGVVGRRRAPAWVRPAFGTGVLGGYTTFSAYAHALDVLVTDGHAGTAAGYLVLSLAGGVLAAAAGLALGARLPARTPGRADHGAGGAP